MNTQPIPVVFWSRNRRFASAPAHEEFVWHSA